MGGERESKCKLSISKVDKLQAIVKSHNWAIEAPHIGAAVAVEQKGVGGAHLQYSAVQQHWQHATCHLPHATQPGFWASQREIASSGGGKMKQCVKHTANATDTKADRLTDKTGELDRLADRQTGSDRATDSLDSWSSRRT